MVPFLWVVSVLCLLLPSIHAHPPTKTSNVVKRDSNAGTNHFVTQGANGQLMVNGSEFKFIGTTAYWLASLNNAQDIDYTLGNISKAGFNVVRTWAFNDVDTIPENGTWFQLIQNGTLTINNGTNGLQKLDTVMQLAQKHGLYVQLSLTNNWNPRPLLDSVNITDPLSISRRDVTQGTNNSLPRGTLSNDYGGMDVYVRQFHGLQEHDQFFTNQTLINAFMNYTNQIVTRYVDNPNVLAWELANDPRCSSSINASSTCTPRDVTQWHSTLAQHVKSLDPNHLVASGASGFLCMGCPKLFPLATPTPRPAPSPAPGSRRRANAVPLTPERLKKERKEAFKKTRAAARRSGASDSGIMIRGRWVSTPTRRQDDSGVGPAFDGSQGVDSEDIFNIPQIGLGSFMYFPDQNNYGPNDPNLPAFNNTVNQGLDWIRQHAEIGRLFGKPITLSGIGLVTQDNAQSFVPFNESTAPFAADTSSPLGPAQQPFATQAQASDALTQWLQAGVLGGLQGMIQYQWTQQNLTAEPGTVIAPTSNINNQQPTSQINTQQGTSPNDGYATNDVGSLAQIVQSVGQGFLPNQ